MTPWAKNTIVAAWLMTFASLASAEDIKHFVNAMPAGERDDMRVEIPAGVHGYQERLIETVTAPVSGFTIYGLARPPVRAGKSIATIARPSTQENLRKEASETQN